MKLQGELAIADQSIVFSFVENLKKIVDENDYSPKQISNFDETGLSWKNTPARTYLAQEEAHASGFTPHKDRVTLLFSCNAYGDAQVKPLLVYRVENPRALKGVKKSSLPVH